MTQVTKGFKYRIYPNKIQSDLIARTFGCNRFVWNNCLEGAIKAHEVWRDNPSLPKPSVGFKDFNSTLNELKTSNVWHSDGVVGRLTD